MIETQSQKGNDVHLQAVDDDGDDDDDEGNVTQISEQQNERSANVYENALLINRCVVQNQVWLGQSSNYVCSNEECTNIAVNEGVCRRHGEGCTKSSQQQCWRSVS